MPWPSERACERARWRWRTRSVMWRRTWDRRSSRRRSLWCRTLAAESSECWCSLWSSSAPSADRWWRAPGSTRRWSRKKPTTGSQSARSGCRLEWRSSRSHVTARTGFPYTDMRLPTAIHISCIYTIWTWCCQRLAGWIILLVKVLWHVAIRPRLTCARKLMGSIVVVISLF